MSITHVGSTGVSTTAAARGTTSTSVAYTDVAAGRIAIITACVKPSTATWGSDPAGWTKVTDATGGTGTNAADTGTSRIGKWYKVLDGSETGSVTISATNTPSQVCGAMDVYSTSLGAWVPPTSTAGTDATHGTNPVAASSAWVAGGGLTTGDVVHVGYATDTDNTGAASAHAIAQTGTTFGTVTARSRVGNSDGNDGSVFTWDGAVTAGGDATATTMSMTWAASSCGAFAALRLREATPITLTQTVVDNFNDNEGTAPTGWTNWGGAQVSESSSRLNITSTTTAGAYFGVDKTTTIDLTDKYVGTKVVSAGNQALTSFAVYPIYAGFSSGNAAYWVINGNIAAAFTATSSTFTKRGLDIAYNSTDYVYFAVGITGSNIRWLYSKDGITWHIHATLANPFGGNTFGTTIMLGTDNAEAGTGVFQVDDYSTWVTAATDLNLTAGAFPSGIGMAGNAASAIDHATTATTQPIIVGGGRAAFAGDSGTNVSGGPVLTGAGRAALVMDHVSASKAQGVAVGTGRATLGIELGTTATNQPVIVATGRASLAIDHATNVDPQPVIGVGGRAALVMDNVTEADSAGASFIGSNWLLRIDHATTVRTQPVIIGAGRATSAIDHATTLKPLNAYVTPGRASLAVDLATAVKSAPVAFTAGLANLVMDRQDTVLSATAYAAPGGIITELLPPDAENLELVAGAAPGAYFVGSTWTLTMDHVTNVKSAPVLIGGGRAALAMNHSTTVKPIPLLVGTGRAVLALDHTTTVRSANVLAGSSEASFAGDSATFVRSAVVLAGVSQQTTAIDHATRVVPVPVIGSAGGRWTLVFVIGGPGLTFWDGVNEQPLILVGVWNGTQIVPAELDDVV